MANGSLKVNVGSLLGAIVAAVGLFLPWVQVEGVPSGLALAQIEASAWARLPLLALTGVALLGVWWRSRLATSLLLAIGLGSALIALVAFEGALAAGFDDPALVGFWMAFAGHLLVAAGGIGRLSTLPGPDRVSHILRDIVPPLTVPAFFFLIWEGAVEGLRIPLAFFPSVTDVALVITSAYGTLLEDTYRTFVQEVLFGYAFGVAIGLVVGVLTAFSLFLQRGFLPLATAFGAVPVVALAPVLGRALGVSWESKAAVAVIVSFFPMVINVVQGLTTLDPLKMDLMRSYAASPNQILRKLRFPNALPYVFSALKITSIISLISVIVAEFLIPGAPEGLGQRISLTARGGRFDVTLAAVVFASVVGILFYYAIVLLERRVIPWHSSFADEE